MLGIGLSRATGGSRTTGMVFLLKGIYLCGFTPMLGIGLSRAIGGSRTTGMVFLYKGIDPSVGALPTPYAPFILTLTPRLRIGRFVASHRWVANHRYGFTL